MQPLSGRSDEAEAEEAAHGRNEPSQPPGPAPPRMRSEDPGVRSREERNGRGWEQRLEVSASKLERPKEEKGIHVAQRNGFRPFYLAAGRRLSKAFREGCCGDVQGPGKERAGERVHIHKILLSDFMV
ncbi:Extracellular Sulfatase Sulf-1 [Manis pentadactyla]|nr:Extracellular Sulfatase Sulf-1 [Manis pentadactyla]